VNDAAERDKANPSDVFASLREDILTLKLAPGVILDEAALSQSLGISRTPLRRVLIQLASENLIVIQPNRGSVVAPLNLNDFPYFIEALSLVYGQTQALAARKADAETKRRLKRHADRFEAAVGARDFAALNDANTDLHLAVAEAADNRRLYRFARSMLHFGQRTSRISFGYEPTGNDSQATVEEYLETVLVEHRAIVEAIDRGDEAEAWRLGVDHAELFRRRMLAFLRQNLAPELAAPA